MPRFATIRGHVTYTPGDGVPIPIPEGRVEIDEADDSVILSWEAEPGTVGTTAMPRLQYDQYLEAGKIVPEDAGGQTATA
ncbi:hypothetical protein [Pseudacidovorax intermedius]|uniref:Uncharacterized protein n=1 Tax=Pseudacidovorax intermedius TaxID=433924 RepID=A0A147HCL9_9BURK|nr:hypothetical protein [Pseudacidovorax intermedius]KTT27897.1 hypothetical protein NS331_00620 [Pseudacidovorax intermedius]